MAHANVAVVMAAREKLANQIANDLDNDDDAELVADFLIGADLIAQDFYNEVAKDLGLEPDFAVGGIVHGQRIDTIPAKMEKGYVLPRRISEPATTWPVSSTLADGNPNVIVGRD